MVFCYGVSSKQIQYSFVDIINAYTYDLCNVL